MSSLPGGWVVPKGAEIQWPTDEQLEELVDRFGSVNAAAENVGVSESALRRRLIRQGIHGRVQEKRRSKTLDLSEKPRAEVHGDVATLVTVPAPQLGDMAELMRERGLDPDEWEVKNAVLNEWDSNAGDGQIIKLRQLKLHLVRKTPIEFVFPAVDVKVRTFRPSKPVKGAPVVHAVFADSHAPYYDVGMHDAVCNLIAGDLDPDVLIDLGDLGDYPTISKFRDNPAWSAPVKACIDTSFQILADRRAASQTARMVLLKGNHDWRLETELLARAERMYHIMPAEIPGEQQFRGNSLHTLLHLDRINCELIEPELDGDDYNHAEFWLTPNLAAIHGKAIKNGAVAHANDMGVSVVMGHTHHQSHHVVTRWENDRRYHLDAVEVGTGRAIGKSVGYANRPKSEQGFAVATTFPDDGHQIELVRWDGRFLSWRGNRYN